MEVRVSVCVHMDSDVQKEKNYDYKFSCFRKIYAWEIFRTFIVKIDFPAVPLYNIY